MNENVRSLVKEVSWNGVRRLSFLTLKSFHTSHTLMERKIFELTHNPLNSCKTHTNSHSNTLLLFSKAKLHKLGINKSKIRGYIGVIGEGKLKGHQINGSLSLGNIIVHLPLPQLMPHFGTLHCRMDNFGFLIGLS